MKTIKGKLIRGSLSVLITDLITVIKKNYTGGYGVYTFEQTIGESFGNFITAFEIAPNSITNTDSVIYPNITPNPTEFSKSKTPDVTDIGGFTFIYPSQ